MDVRVGDKLIMKKNHPCGSNEFAVLRIGMDFRIRLAYFAAHRVGGQE